MAPAPNEKRTTLSTERAKMLETHQLYSEAIDAIGPKQVSNALNLSLAHVYKLAADPHAVDAPVRNDLDRISMLIDLMAARPDAKPALHLWRIFFADVFARAIDREEVTALCGDTLSMHTEKLCREFADVIHEMRKDFMPDAVARQAAELIAALTLLVRCAEVADDRPKNVTNIRQA